MSKYEINLNKLKITDGSKIITAYQKINEILENYNINIDNNYLFYPKYSEDKDDTINKLGIRRMKVLIDRHNGMKINDIAKKEKISIRTVKNYIKYYNNINVLGELWLNKKQKNKKLSTGLLNQLFVTKPAKSFDDATKRINKYYFDKGLNKSISKTQVYKYIKKYDYKGIWIKKK